MPSSNETKPLYQKDEKALCFHGELLYEAKVLEVRRQDPKDKQSAFEYRVHYKGWKNTWDDWVPQDRLRKLTEDNKELAANLRRELTQQLQPKSAKAIATSKSRKQGSEFGSGRGSEERHSSVPAGGRGTKRGRDNDIEKSDNRITWLNIIDHRSTTTIMPPKKGSNLFPAGPPNAPVGLDPYVPRASAITARDRIQAAAAPKRKSPRKARPKVEAESDGENDPAIDDNTPAGAAGSPLSSRKTTTRRSRAVPSAESVVEVESSSDSVVEVGARVARTALGPSSKKKTTIRKPQAMPEVEDDGEFDDPIDSNTPAVVAPAFPLVKRKMAIPKTRKKSSSQSVVEVDPQVERSAAIKDTAPAVAADDGKKVNIEPLSDIEKTPERFTFGRAAIPSDLEETPEPFSSSRAMRSSLAAVDKSRFTPETPSYSNISSDGSVSGEYGAGDDYEDNKEDNDADDDADNDANLKGGKKCKELARESVTSLRRSTRGRPAIQEKADAKKAGKTRQVVTRKWHQEFVRTDNSLPASSSSKKPAKKPSRRLANMKPVENMPSQPEPEESIDDILARPAPPDEPEYISHATARSGAPMFAPLIGGTTAEEEYKIKQELAAAGKITLPERLHPKWIEARNKEPANFEKHLFYEGVDPKKHLVIAGVAKDPLQIDPPGSGTPFDALKFPDRLVAQLNRDDEQTLWGWNEKSLKTIPAELIRRLNPEILVKLPDAVLAKQPQDILDSLPSEAPFFQNLPANSKLKRPEHRAGFTGKEGQTQSKPRAIRSTKPAAARRASANAAFNADRNLKPAKERDAAGKFLPRGARVKETGSKDKGEQRATSPTTDQPAINPVTGRPTGPVAPVSDAKCSTCVSMGIKCTGEKPVCGWCRRQGQKCSFQDEDAAEPSPKPKSKGNPNNSVAQLLASTGYQAYLPPFVQEENFATRPSIRISIPDHLKSLLVDDWEYVTKNMMLVPLPSQAPANYIIDTYYHEEKDSRRIGSADLDVLEEFCSGMKVYFEKALGKILLYRFERNQLAEVRKFWESGRYPAWEDKGPGDCYGAEHLARMLVNMPELIAQTNMDTQSVARLREEISKFCVWLARNSATYFVAKYEKPTEEYIQSAR